MPLPPASARPVGTPGSVGDEGPLEAGPDRAPREDAAEAATAPPERAVIRARPVVEPAVTPGREPPRETVSRGVFRQGNRIIATVGRAVQLELDRPVATIVVGDPEIVSDVLAEPTRVFLVGKTAGATNVFLRDEDGRVIEMYEMTVKADMDGLREALAAVLPESRLKITPTQGGVVLTGQVRSAVEAANAERVAGQFVGSDGAVVNSLNIAGDQQVLLRVRVSEMNRTARKFLATDTNFDVGRGGDALFRTVPFFNNITGTTIERAGTIGAGLAITAPTGALLINELGIDDITFSTLEDKGLVRLLAEPALTAISGETANFLVGGEFPVPVGRDDDGRIIIEFKDFGVKLSFTPVVLSDNQISLRINTEVSRLSEENSLLLDGLVIPGLSTRRAESTVMLPSGGSLMIAGLLQTEDRNAIQGIPGLMDLPVLGALFRSQDFQNERSELVVTVEAFKVRPRQFGPEFVLPTDGFRPADDLDIYLLGRLHDRYSGGGGPPVMVGAPFGYIME
nr:type II and III secretion system protein family protein [Roseospira goensis]